MKKIIFATGNAHKLKEVREIFADTNVELLSLNDFSIVPDIIEYGETFKENSLIKVRKVFGFFNIPAVGDDSGLTVEQLNGAPGVFSARYSGEDATYESNNQKLLKELEKFPPPHKASFICTASYFDGETTITAFGKLEGEIVQEYRGQNGFGYDPIFKPEGYETTLAEITLAEKNRISHRGKAFRELKEKLLDRQIIQNYEL